MRGATIEFDASKVYSSPVKAANLWTITSGESGSRKLIDFRDGFGVVSSNGEVLTVGQRLRAVEQHLRAVGQHPWAAEQQL